MRRVVCLLTSLILLQPLGGCDKEGGDDGGEPESIAMTTHSLAHETATASWNFTIEAPEQVTPEVYMNLAFDLFADEWFKIRVTPRDDRDLAALRARLDEMNIDGYEVFIEEPNTLFYRVDAMGDRQEFELYHKVQLGDTTVLCESIPPIGDPYTREQADRMLESCRSLAQGE